MSTTDTVLLIIVTAILSIFFLAGIFLIIAVIKLISAIRKVVDKAEDLVDSAEEVADVFKDTKGHLAFFKLIMNIIKLAQGRKK